MKKVIFLFLIMLCQIPSVDAANEVLFDVNGETIKTSRERIEGVDYLYLERLGNQPFFTTVSVEGHVFNISNIRYVNQQYVAYGSVHNQESDTYYDAWILWLDSHGNVIQYQIYELGKLEQISYVDYLEDTWMVLLKQHQDINHEIVYDTNYIMTLHPDLTLAESVEFSEEITSVTREHNRWLISSDHGQTIFASITASLEVTRTTESISIEPNQEFYGEVHIPFLNSALINGEEYHNGVTIAYPGYYVITYHNRNIPFTVSPIVTGIEDGMIVTDDVSFIVSSGQVFVNELLYESGVIIDEPGYYEVTITGVNGYVKTMHFTITAQTNNLINDHIYTEPFVVEFKGRGYLNNQYIESPIEIEKDGEYLLFIEGEGGYLEQYMFELKTKEKEPTMLDYIQKYDFIVFGIVIVMGVFVYKKK